MSHLRPAAERAVRPAAPVPGGQAQRYAEREDDGQPFGDGQQAAPAPPYSSLLSTSRPRVSVPSR